MRENHLHTSVRQINNLFMGGRRGRGEEERKRESERDEHPQWENLDELCGRGRGRLKAVSTFCCYQKPWICRFLVVVVVVVFPFECEATVVCGH